MRARITLAVVAILALALAIAGVVTAELLRSAARTSARQLVLTQTDALVNSVNGSGRLHQLLESDQGAGSEQLLQQVLSLVQSITGASANDLLVTAGGSLLGASPGPSMSASQLHDLARCRSVSGLRGDVAYAAAPLVCIPASLSTSGAGAIGSATGASAGAGAGATGATRAGGSRAAGHGRAGTGAGSPGRHGRAPTSAPAATTSSAASPNVVSTVAIVLSEPVTYSASSVWYFVLAAAVALVVAGTVAALIARRISRQVVAAAGAAEAIASGDLAVRLPEGDHAYPELVALGSAINTMAAGLARARALERQFLLSVSHDLRTPLTSIRGYTEAIADGAVPDPRAAAGVVMAEAARLERLIRDLLDLAYLDARQFSLHPASLDLGAAVGSAAEALRYELEASALSLEVRKPASPLVVSADGDRLAQIVANLVENAGKYAQRRVVVSVAGVAGGAETGAEARRRGLARSPSPTSPRAPEGGGGPTVAVVVEDDGPGIAPEDLPHVFERLFTSERRPSRAARGTGLGLAIVAELAAAMGGTVHAESPITTGGGTRMTVQLPLQQPALPAPAVPVRGGPV